MGKRWGCSLRRLRQLVEDQRGAPMMTGGLAIIPRRALKAGHHDVCCGQVAFAQIADELSRLRIAE